MARYLSLDLGTKTIGIASSEGIIASPKTTILFEEDNFEQGIKKLSPILEEEKPEKLIIGYPINMNGSVGPRAEMVNDFIKLIMDNKLFAIENIVKIDERLTTKMARNIMISANLSRNKQKQHKDSLAAQIIMETFLNSHKK